MSREWSRHMCWVVWDRPGLVPPFTCNSASVWMINYIVTLIKWLKYHIYIMNHRLQNTLLLYSVQKLTAKKRKSKPVWGLNWICFIVFQIGLQLLAISGTLPPSYPLAVLSISLYNLQFCLPYYVWDFQSKHLHSGRRKKSHKNTQPDRFAWALNHDFFPLSLNYFTFVTD